MICLAQIYSLHPLNGRQDIWKYGVQIKQHEDYKKLQQRWVILGCMAITYIPSVSVYVHQLVFVKNLISCNIALYVLQYISKLLPLIYS